MNELADDYSEQIRRVEYYKLIGDDVQVFDACTKAINIAPTPYLLVTKGEAALAVGRPQEALEVLDNLLVLEDRALIAIVQQYRGAALSMLGKLEAALDACSMSLVAQRNPLVFITRGEILYKMKKYYDALGDYLDAEKLGGAPHLYHNIACAYLALREPKTALEYLNKQLSLGEDPLSLEVRALTYEDIGENKKAIADLFRALEIEPTPTRYFYLGNICIKEHDIKAASNCFDKALELEPNNFTVRTHKANSLALQGLLEEALELYNTLLEECPDADLVRLNRSHVYDALGRVKESNKDLAFVKKRNPELYKRSQEAQGSIWILQEEGK